MIHYVIGGLAGGTHLGAKKEEEVGPDLNRPVVRFGIIHRSYRRDAAASIGCRPVAWKHNQDRPDFPPDRLSIHLGIVDHVAVVRCRHKDWGGGGATLGKQHGKID